MERTPDGTPVGVDDPYAVAGVCDHLTDDGRCRYALAHAGNDPAFAAERRADGYACHVGPESAWRACPHYRSTTAGTECVRCGLGEIRMAHDDARPLLEEHHLMYGDAGTERSVAEGDEAESGEGTEANADTEASDDTEANAVGSDDAGSGNDAEIEDVGPHEITVSLCRWCHAKVHGSIARIDDDARPDPEAIAERERRGSRERSEAAFETARERYDGGDGR